MSASTAPVDLIGLGSVPGAECKFMDGSFNSNRTNFGGKSVFSTGFGKGNDAINLLTNRPTQPAAKLLDKWFNGNSTCVNVAPRSKGVSPARLMMPM